MKNGKRKDLDQSERSKHDLVKAYLILKRMDP